MRAFLFVPASATIADVVFAFDDLVAIARVPHPIHPELGRETPPRQWYCVSRRGRVGRCQVFQGEDANPDRRTARIFPRDVFPRPVTRSSDDPSDPGLPN